MQKIIYTLIISIIFIVSPAFAYETSKQIKIDAVNSYQPMQFVSGNVNSTKKTQTSTDLNPESKQFENSYIEHMPLDESYVSKSPISKENSKIEVPENEMLEDSTLEGSVLAQEKPQGLNGRQKWDKFCTVIKGQPAPDAVLLGMWSKHVVTKNRNETNELMALQYGGISGGYFKNSWYKDTYFLTVARTPWTKKFKNDMSIDFQYKAGIMHGYGDHAPLALGPVEAFLMPAFAFSYKTSGFDIWFVPNPMAAVFAINFRVGIPDKLTYESVHARRLEKHPPKPKVVEPPPINQYEQIQKEQIKKEEI